MSQISRSIKTVARILPRGLRNWLRSPRRSWQTLLDAARARLVGPVSVALRPDWTARLHPAAARAIVTTQLSDPLQLAELNSFIGHCSPGMSLIDCGAHFGVFSLAAVHYGGASASAVAVEPSPYAGAVLEYNSAANGAAHRMTWTRAAVAEEVGGLPMLAVGAIGHGYFVSADEEHPERDVVTVPAVTIDSLVASHALHPTHVKIDVEGAEFAVLQGAAATLETHRPIVFLELHCDMIRDRGEDPLAVSAHLRDRGYELRDCAHEPLDESVVSTADLVRMVALPVASAG